jgi:hypothetical protein
MRSFATIPKAANSEGWWAALDGYRNAVAELARQRADLSGGA